MIIKDNSQRARTAILVFWILIAIGIIAIWSGYMQYELLDIVLNNGTITEEEANNNDLRQTIVSWTQTVIYVVCIVTFLSWFRRAYGNLHRLKTEYLEFSEQQAVYGFIIPFVNLVRPFKIMREVWTETNDIIAKSNSSFGNSYSSTFISVWWTLFLLSGFMSNFAARVMLRADTVIDLQNSTLAYLFADSIEIPAALAAIYLINRVSDVEMVMAENIRLGKAGFTGASTT